MKKSTKLKLFRLLAAVMIFNQAVFLLGPVNIASAQTASYITLISPTGGSVSDMVTLQAQTDISIDKDKVVFEIGSNSTASECWVRFSAGSQSGNDYFLDWDSSTCSNGTYPVTAEAWSPDYSSTTFSQTYFITIDNAQNIISYPTDLTLIILSPTAIDISGQTTISVQTNVDTSLVNFLNINLTGFGRNDIWTNSDLTIDSNNNTYSFVLDTVALGLENGEHWLYFNAEADRGDGQIIFGTNSMAVNVNNQTTTTDNQTTTTDNQTTTTDNQITTEIIPQIDPYTSDLISFTFLENFQSPFSGDQTITISLNQEVEEVNVFVDGPASVYLQKIDSSPLYYYFTWQTESFPDGVYKVTATASKGDDSFTKSFSTDVKNNIDSYEETEIITEDEENLENNLTEEPEDNPLDEFKEDYIIYDNVEQIKEYEEISLNFIKPAEGSEVKGWTKLVVKTFGPVRRVEFFIVEENEYDSLGVGHFNGYNWEFGWDTNRYENANYSLIAYGWDHEENKIESNEIVLSVKNQEYTTKPEYENQFQELIDKSFIDETRPYQSPFEPFKSDYVPQPIENFEGDMNMEDQTFYKDSSIIVDFECKKVGITDMEECRKYLDFIYLPIECQEANVQSFEECDKIMMPQECQEANVQSFEECDKHMRLIHMPQECQEANVTSEEECEKIMFGIYGPEECIEAGINDKMECEKFIFKDNVPPDCQEAGISNPEACEKYVFEKYGGMENVPTDKFPPECQEAGAETADECDEIMKKKYMPRECTNQGINDEEECEIYLNKKYMPNDCRDAGAQTREECDNVMFNKYAPKECKDAGTTSDEECKNLMTELYSPKITCEGIEGEECKNVIKKRHIGNVIAKQTKFKEIKEKVGQKRGESITMEELEADLGIAKDIIPIKKGGISFRIVETDEKLILDEGENLIQTAPVALMIDSDKDGLSDDMEKRLGTDPNNEDSDGDGYKDGEEIKSGYNALGEGEVRAAFAPIDQAILQNKILGQPKTDGELSEELKIENITNVSENDNGEEEGYNFSGQAEPDSVVTLYIYSDMPLVVTTKVDRYGNWQYELQESLIEGEHEVYVAVNDNTGKVVSRSNPLNFFVQEAKAVSVQDFVASAATERVMQSESESIAKYYLIITTLIIIIGILLFAIYFIQKKKKRLI